MSSAKQPQLNGAYYGPPVPPPRHPQPYYGTGRSRCGPGCCVCSLFKIVASIVVVVGIIALVVWLVLRPDRIKAYAESATLARFDLGGPGGDTIQHNLTVDIGIRNPNRKVGIYYDYLEAHALYDGERFGLDVLPPFYQGHKSTETIKPVFDGSSVVFGDVVGSTYRREKGEGYYYIEVKVYADVRLRVGIFRIRYFKSKIDCMLRLPVPGNATSTAPTILGTECDVDL